MSVFLGGVLYCGQLFAVQKALYKFVKLLKLLLFFENYYDEFYVFILCPFNLSFSFYGARKPLPL